MNMRKHAFVTFLAELEAFVVQCEVEVMLVRLMRP